MSDSVIRIRAQEDVRPHVALDGVDLDIGTGGIGILGPNGSGKSTLFKCILGLIRITEGGGTVLGKGHRYHGPEDTLQNRLHGRI